MKISYSDLPGMRVTVMGLGLHGGGVAAAAFLVSHGANVTVTDLQDETALSPSVGKLSCYPGIRFVLGRHEDADFRHTDMVIKNPAVPRTARHLGLARRIETDISVYLKLTHATVLGITGTKGKSTTASATASLLGPRGARLGGNITVSPLSFLDEEGINPGPTVLELSSFQLGDLQLTGIEDLGPWPYAGALTSFMRDHQNYYGSMTAYLYDKTCLFRHQGTDDWMLLNPDAAYAGEFLNARRGRLLPVSSSPGGSATPRAYRDGPLGTLVDTEGEHHVVVPDMLLVPGEHNRTNLLYAASLAWIAGMDLAEIAEAIGGFRGIPHRMETVRRLDGRLFVNDSAATVPEATLAAVQSYDLPIHLVCGGTDKDLDFGLFPEIVASVSQCYLLEGNASTQIASALEEAGLAFRGPFGSLEEAVHHAYLLSVPESVVLLSPGCASFGMFRNEFDRGDQFREVVRSL